MEGSDGSRHARIAGIDRLGSLACSMATYDWFVTGVDIRRFAWAVAAFALVLLVGTVGFVVLLDDSWVDSFYRAVVSTTLTGLASAPETDAAKIFTVILLFSGVAVFFYIAGVIVDVMTRGVLSGVLEERRRKRTIDELSDHVIICGYGRVGRSVAAEFSASGTPCVVVDVTPESVELANSDGVPVVLGDGTEDNDLDAAGLMRARGLVASVDSDEKNLYITRPPGRVAPISRSWRERPRRLLRGRSRWPAPTGSCSPMRTQDCTWRTSW